MTKVSLVKLAIDFAFANHQADAITQAEGSIAAFKAAGGRAEDLPIWQASVSQHIGLAGQLAKQKLPSEQMAAAAAIKAPVSNATAATTIEPETK